MAQFIPSAPGTTPYKQNILAMALRGLAEGGGGLASAIQKYREAEILKTPLAQYLNVDPGALPEGLRPFGGTAMGKFKQLGDYVGHTSFGSLLRPPAGGPSVPFFMDPATGGFSMTPGAGMVPVPGVGGSKAVGAMQKQQAIETQKKALMLRKTISDRLTAKDSREEERLALSQLKLAIDPYMNINMDQLPPEALTRFSSLLDQSLTTVEALKKVAPRQAPAAPAPTRPQTKAAPAARPAANNAQQYKLGDQVRTREGKILTLTQVGTGLEWR